MEVVQGTYKATRFISEDVISHMPENVITDILNRVPIQDAMRTSILARNWRLKWTLLTQLVFDEDFIEFIKGKGQRKNHGKNISRILLHLRGDITKFVLHIPNFYTLDNDDINHWLLYLSVKGIKELTLINNGVTPLKLSSWFFSCLELRHLTLYKCHFRTWPNFCGFPNLLSLDLYYVVFFNYNHRELISRCPLLEILRIRHCVSLDCITSPTVFCRIGCLPKLQELDFDIWFKLFMEIGAGKTTPIDFLPSLKTLSLNQVNFSSDIMVSSAIKMICCSPNLQTLKITGITTAVSSPAISSSEVDCITLQLLDVELKYFGGSESEICFIEFLLASSPMLKKIVIHTNSPSLNSDSKKFAFARKLLKLYRASSVVKIDLNLL